MFASTQLRRTLLSKFQQDTLPLITSTIEMCMWRNAMKKTHGMFLLLRILLGLIIASAFSGMQTVSASLLSPTPISPSEGSFIIFPCFSWQAVTDAAKYEVEVGPQSDLNAVFWTAQTDNLTLTPNDAYKFSNIPLYWRVRAYDSLNVSGAWSSKINFTKHIPAPVLVSPPNGHSNIHIPKLVWQPVDGATYYKVEISLVDTFETTEATYTTYNTSLTPMDTIAHGLHYWRVSGVDADGHVGTPSGYRTFTKTTDGPVLVSPGVNESITIPRMEWEAVDGATYYKVELSINNTFSPVLATYSIYNLQITPVDFIAYNTYYWRVSGVDADDHVGINYWRKFTLNAPPAAIDSNPHLIAPANGQTITADPNFSWTRMIGAHDYNLVVSKESDFSTTYDTIFTHYNSYTPAIIESPDAYPNGIYYWRVEARNMSGTKIGASEEGYFTKGESLMLVAPADGATLVVDPSFQWDQIIGAHHYNLVVSKEPDFSPTYDTVLTDYNSYTSAIIEFPDAYPNGIYYWKVEARTKDETVIVTSEARSFTKEESLPLVAPTDGATLMVDPTFQWNQIIGAHHYNLVVSKEPDFSQTYDTVLTDYNSYTPFIGESPNPYANDTYYWKVEARTNDETVIVTSNDWSFSNGISLYLPIILR